MDRAVNALIRIFICSENKRDSLNLILIYKIFILHCIKEIGFFIIYDKKFIRNKHSSLSYWLLDKAICSNSSSFTCDYLIIYVVFEFDFFKFIGTFIVYNLIL